MVDDVPNTTAMAQARGSRHSRANSRALAGATAIGPVASAAGSSSADDEFRVMGVSRGSGGATAGAAPRELISISAQGITPASANTAHIASERRQPAA